MDCEKKISREGLPPEGSPERIEARRVVHELTYTVLGAGNLTPEEWKEKLPSLHPEVVSQLSRRDIEMIITVTERHLSLR